MTTNEPTTGEIVRGLREVVSDPMFRIHEIAKRCRVAADRLESQEQSNERLTTALAEVTMKVGELTARAEQAEATMKAIVDVVNNGSVVCTICANRRGWDTCKPCKFKWSGLPQDGEGK